MNSQKETWHVRFFSMESYKTPKPVDYGSYVRYLDEGDEKPRLVDATGITVSTTDEYEAHQLVAMAFIKAYKENPELKLVLNPNTPVWLQAAFYQCLPVDILTRLEQLER